MARKKVSFPGQDLGSLTAQNLREEEAQPDLIGCVSNCESWEEEVWCVLLRRRCRYY